MGATQSSRSTRHVAAAVTDAVKNTNATTLALNLKKIGQVNVQSPVSSIQRSLEMTHVLRTRALSESTIDIQTNNPNTPLRTIDSFGLSQLLDARKDAPPTKAQQLAERYRLDDRMVQRLTKRYNTPSIGREHTIGLSDGDRRLYREAIWVDAGQAKSQANQDSIM